MSSPTCFIGDLVFVDLILWSCTKDSVPIKIDAVVYYKIFDAAKSIITVENFNLASTLLAQSKLRDVLGKYDIDMLLSNKEHIGKELLDVLQ